MKNIAILASGSGTNFQAIVKARKKGIFKANIKLLVTDTKNAFARQRARHLNISEIFVDPKKSKSRIDFDREIVKLLKKEKIDYVILAGYMRLLSPIFVNAFKNKILNIHPALLPSFKGIHSIKRAFEYGCKVTGVTVHLIDEKVDNGPIVLQESVRITKATTLKSLESKIHKLEHELYPKAISLLVENRLKIRKRKVTFR
ncbi:MAG: phosphoribosylglycinamide formyltransferase [Candidatus Omnitrophica bacterium]|nr:phosphoribosylglycinamide formyltransferase [Candidatus Omnitrophota bacterium]